MHNVMRTKWFLVLTSIMAVGLCGCAGPVLLKGNRFAYNKAVQSTANRELLLNLVRMRYRDPPKFLQIGAVNATFSLGGTANLGATYVSGSSANIYTPGVGASFTETPTVTYQPLQGAEFATRTQKEMSLETLILLLRGGWDLEPIMRIGVERIGGLLNYTELPSYKRFFQLTKLWRAAQLRGDLNFVQAAAGKPAVVADAVPAQQVNLEALMAVAKAGLSLKPRADGKFQVVKAPSPVLVLQVRYLSEAEAAKADTLLGIQPKHIPVFDGSVIVQIRLIDPVEAAKPAPPGQEITDVPIWLRSFYNQLFFAALGIQVPPEDQQVVGMTTDPQGHPSNPWEAFKDIFNIRVSNNAPNDAFVAVRYRGHSFYIDDRDIASKKTFNMLSVVFDLQSSKQQVSPVLTIPVGGR